MYKAGEEARCRSWVKLQYINNRTRREAHFDHFKLYEKDKRINCLLDYNKSYLGRNSGMNKLKLRCRHRLWGIMGEGSYIYMYNHTLHLWTHTRRRFAPSNTRTTQTKPNPPPPTPHPPPPPTPTTHHPPPPPPPSLRSPSCPIPSTPPPTSPPSVR
jgi:hypothetical protein